MKSKNHAESYYIAMYTHWLDPVRSISNVDNDRNESRWVVEYSHHMESFDDCDIHRIGNLGDDCWLGTVWRNRNVTTEKKNKKQQQQLDEFRTMHHHHIQQLIEFNLLVVNHQSEHVFDRIDFNTIP